MACVAALFLRAPLSHAQSGGTGAIAGTVTDPQGRAVPNATVAATSLATNQERTATTGSAGDYKFSLLSPGTYRLRITAAGFKTAEIAGVTVNTTETASVDKVLEIGAVTQTVTVESTVETLQTESSALGTTVSGTQINALPMANGNYTEILSLSAGATVGVDNATSVGKGTQDISANGVDPGSNNFQMDGVAIKTSPTPEVRTTALSTPESRFPARTPSPSLRSRRRPMTRVSDQPRGQRERHHQVGHQ